EPVAKRRCLLFAQARQWHIDVAPGQIDPRQTLLIGKVAGDVARAFAVPHDPKPVWPSWRHVCPPAFDWTDNTSRCLRVARAQPPCAAPRAWPPLQGEVF